MPIAPIENCTVVIRSIGERTEKTCLEIVKEQLPSQSQIKVIRDLPFAEAHAKSLQFAANADTRYAIFLDADILLHQQAIPMMIAEANRIIYPFFMINFRILDYQFESPTYAGVHLYNTQYVNKALSLVHSALAEQRPETFIVNQIAKLYHIPSIGSDFIVGLHGYEQSYFDEYRTMFVRAVKFSHRADFLFNRIYSRYTNDPSSIDNKLLLYAFLDGSFYKNNNKLAPLKSQFYYDYYNKHKELLSLTEKPPMQREDVDVEKVISEFKPDDLFEENKSWLCPSGYKTKLQQPFAKRIFQKVYRFAKRFKKAVWILFKDGT